MLSTSPQAMRAFIWSSSNAWPKSCQQPKNMQNSAISISHLHNHLIDKHRKIDKWDFPLQKHPNQQKQQKRIDLLIWSYSTCKVTGALTDVAFCIMLASAYLLEYVRARVSAGILFSMLRDKPAIDSHEDSGSRAVSADFLFIVMVSFVANYGRLCCGQRLVRISERSDTTSSQRSAFGKDFSEGWR